MYAEITENIFRKIVTTDTPLDRNEELEHALKEFWRVDGVEVMAIHNYLSSVTQYYILDINS